MFTFRWVRVKLTLTKQQLAGQAPQYVMQYMFAWMIHSQVRRHLSRLVALTNVHLGCQILESAFWVLDDDMEMACTLEICRPIFPWGHGENFNFSF